MKSFLKSGVLVLVLATLGVQANPTKKSKLDGSAGISFDESAWAKILERAKKEKKIIFFDAYASWCGPCKQMQKNVFTRPEVANFFNTNFINVKKDMEEGEGPALANKYPLEAYPTLFFIDGNGKVIRQVIGYQTPEQLLALGKIVAKK